MVREAGKQLSSSYELRLFISNATAFAPGDSIYTLALAEILGPISSSYEKRLAIESLVAKRHIDPASRRPLMEALLEISSSYEKSTAIQNLAHSFAADRDANG